MSEDTTKAEGGLTRREMLKKSALVGAVAWAVPIVGSFNAPAFGTHGEVVSPAACTDWTCGQAQDVCGDSGPFALCLCDVDTEGNAFCWENILCSLSPACTTTTDCPAGMRCATTCCGSSCLFPCGTNGTGVETTTEMTAAG